MAGGRPQSPRTLQQVEQLRELAAQGVWAREAAKRLGIDASWVSQLHRRFGIPFPPKPKMDSEYHRTLRDGFARGLTPKQLAELTGRKIDTVSVTLCKMGLTAGRRLNDPGKYRRPFDVPDELFGRYRELKKLGLTYEEISRELKLPMREAA